MLRIFWLSTAALLTTIMIIVSAAAQDSTDATTENQVHPIPSPGDETLIAIGSMEGRVIGVEENTVHVELVGYPESRLELDLDLLAPSSRYLIKRRVLDPQGADDWLALAEYAKSEGLFHDRINALRRAVELDPARRESVAPRLSAARRACARDRLAKARQLVDAAELDRAIRHLRDTLLHYEACIETPQVRNLLARLETRRSEERVRAAGIREERRRIRETSDDLRDVRALLEEGEDHVSSGRQDFDEYVDATRHFRAAVGLYEEAMATLDRVDPVSRSTELDQATYDNVDLAEEQERLRLTLEDALIDARVELGHVFIARGDLQSANQQAGRAARLDASDSRVIALRQAIAAAGADDDIRVRPGRRGRRNT